MKQIDTIETYKEAYAKSVNAPEDFWAEVAGDFFWQKKWDKVLQWDFDKPTIKWFDGAQVNLTENCLDRHLQERPNQVALIWEPNDPAEQSRSLTYKQLHAEVCRFANAMLKLGVKKGDRVCIYLPMVLEGAIAMLACARIGAIHSVVFAGFSSNSIVDRVNDATCTLLITADAVYRGDKKVELKKIVDEALQQTPSIKNCIVLNH
ncbi:MAG TPA: AMP-binding protein, partial [Chitinophagales bacterium]|nr:AMP-binding protein [Chitinophagales bacterium]